MRPSYLQRDTFFDFEITQHAQVGAEVRGTAELVAVSVSIVGSGRTGDERCGKSRRVEIAAAQVDLGAGYARAWRLAAHFVELTDQKAG
jgi:hypothetical protein